jgi:hypothetical protein
MDIPGKWSGNSVDATFLRAIIDDIQSVGRHTVAGVGSAALWTPIRAPILWSLS